MNDLELLEEEFVFIDPGTDSGNNTLYIAKGSMEFWDQAQEFCFMFLPRNLSLSPKKRVLS
jgi:hypothetical protein